MTEQTVTVPDTDESDEIQRLEELERQELAGESEVSQDEKTPDEKTPAPADGDEDKKPANGEDEEKESLSAEEWKKRHDNLQKALKEERGKRREGDEYKRKFAEIEDRLAKLTPQQREDARADAEQRPDAQKDPLKALDWALSKIERYETYEAEKAKEQEEAQKRETIVTSLRTFGAESEEAFRQENPDYDDAAAFYAESRVKELQEQGYAPQEAQSMLSNELLSLLARARQNERDPAAAVYSIAKARGYAKKSNAAEQQLEQIEKGKRSSPTMPTGGKSKNNTVSMDELLKATGKDFDRLWQQAEKEGLLTAR